MKNELCYNENVFRGDVISVEMKDVSFSEVARKGEFRMEHGGRKNDI